MKDRITLSTSEQRRGRVTARHRSGRQVASGRVDAIVHIVAAEATLRRGRTWSLWVILLAGLAFVADEGTKALAWHLIPVYPYSRGVCLIRPFLFLQHRDH